MAKFRMTELKQHLAGINSIIEDYTADRAAERAATGADQPPTEPAMAGPAAADSDPWSRGQYGVKPKGLTAIVGPSGGLLESIEGYQRINQHHSDAFKAKKSVE